MPSKAYWDGLWDKSGFLVEDPAQAQNEYLTAEVKLCLEKYCSEGGVTFLEAGCGLGMWNFLLERIERVKLSVGIDISDAILAAQGYKLKHSCEKVHFLKANLENLPFQEESFNFITSLGVIEHFANPSTPLQEMQRVLMRGGIIFLDTPNKGLWSIFNKFFPIQEYEDYYTPQELKALLSRSGFEVLEAYAKGFSNSVMTPLYSIYDYNPDSLVSRAYHCLLQGLKCLINPLDRWLDTKYGFYSIVIARKY